MGSGDLSGGAESERGLRVRGGSERVPGSERGSGVRARSGVRAGPRGASGVRAPSGSRERRGGRAGSAARPVDSRGGTGCRSAGRAGSVTPGTATGRPEEEPGPDPGCGGWRSLGHRQRGQPERQPNPPLHPAANAFPRLCCHRVKTGETGEAKEPPHRPDGAGQGCRAGPALSYPLP